MGQYAYGVPGTAALSQEQQSTIEGPPIDVIVMGVVVTIIGLWLISVDRKMQQLAQAARETKITQTFIDNPFDRKMAGWIFWNILEMLLLFAAIFVVCYLRPNLIFIIFFAIAGIQLLYHLWFDHKPLKSITNLFEFQMDMKYQIRRELAVVTVLLTVLLVVMFDYIETAVDSKAFVYAIAVLALNLFITMYWYLKMPTTSYMQYSTVITCLITVAASLLLVPFD
jgi:hypothetical protein